MYHVIEKIIKENNKKEYLEKLEKLDYWNNTYYLRELESRSECNDFGDYFNHEMQEFCITYHDVEWRSHYSSMFCNAISPDSIFTYLFKKYEINNSRVFRFLIKKHGLDCSYMFNLSGDDYLEVQDNYLSQSVNTRLYQIKDFLENQFYDTLDFLQKKCDEVYADYWHDSYFEGSREDYLEYLQDLEISDLEDMYIELIENK